MDHTAHDELVVMRRSLMDQHLLDQRIHIELETALQAAFDAARPGSSPSARADRDAVLSQLSRLVHGEGTFAGLSAALDSSGDEVSPPANRASRSRPQAGDQIEDGEGPDQLTLRYLVESAPGADAANVMRHLAEQYHAQWVGPSEVAGGIWVTLFEARAGSFEDQPIRFEIYSASGVGDPVVRALMRSLADSVLVVIDSSSATSESGRSFISALQRYRASRGELAAPELTVFVHRRESEPALATDPVEVVSQLAPDAEIVSTSVEQPGYLFGFALATGAAVRRVHRRDSAGRPRTFGLRREELLAILRIGAAAVAEGRRLRSPARAGGDQPTHSAPATKRKPAPSVNGSAITSGSSVPPSRKAGEIPAPRPASRAARDALSTARTEPGASQHAPIASPMLEPLQKAPPVEPSQAAEPVPVAPTKAPLTSEARHAEPDAVPGHAATSEPSGSTEHEREAAATSEPSGSTEHEQAGGRAVDREIDLDLDETPWGVRPQAPTKQAATAESNPGLHRGPRPPSAHPEAGRPREAASYVFGVSGVVDASSTPSLDEPAIPDLREAIPEASEVIDGRAAVTGEMLAITVEVEEQERRDPPPARRSMLDRLLAVFRRSTTPGVTATEPEGR